SLMGFSPGRVHTDGGSTSELFLSVKVPCVGGNARFGSYTGIPAPPPRPLNARAYWLQYCNTGRTGYKTAYWLSIL
ncbi:MAG: hypothetical protein ACK55Z_06860, partial [bacterium]